MIPFKFLGPIQTANQISAGILYLTKTALIPDFRPNLKLKIVTKVNDMSFSPSERLTYQR